MNSIEELRIVHDDDMRRMSAEAWAEAHQEEIRSLLEAEGAVLIRGLKVLGSTQFGKILSTLFGADLLEYLYRSTPRTELGGHVYTATEYPAYQTIPQHNENAYSRTWPLRLGFMCLLPSDTGGETPIGDSRVVYDMLPESMREKFEEKGVKYVRNYSTLDLPWLGGLPDLRQVAGRGLLRGQRFGVRVAGGRRTPDQSGQPRHGRPPADEREGLVQPGAPFPHLQPLRKRSRETLLDSLREENLPRNSYYGDGSPIEPEVLDLIRSTYEETK